MSDPVFQAGDGKWGFWTETWADFMGMYETEQEARIELERYSLWLDGKLPEQNIVQVDMS